MNSCPMQPFESQVDAIFAQEKRIEQREVQLKSKNLTGTERMGRGRIEHFDEAFCLSVCVVYPPDGACAKVSKAR